MKLGDIILLSTTTRQGKLIQGFTECHWSHVGVIGKEGLVYDFHLEGKQIVPLDDFVNDHRVDDYAVFREECTQEFQPLIVGIYDRLFEHAKYDLHGVVALAEKCCFGRDNDNVHYRRGRIQGFHCASLLAYAYASSAEQYGWENPLCIPDVHWSQVVPRDFSDFLSILGKGETQ